MMSFQAKKGTFSFNCFMLSKLTPKNCIDSDSIFKMEKGQFRSSKKKS
jgi:hypothetical protein